jgi:hypothetical protein
MSDAPYVYLARRADGVYKIGFSADPKSRMKSLRQEFGKKFRLVKAWQRADAYRIEKLAQRTLRLKTHLASRGWETFKAPRKVIVAAIEETIRVVDERKAA